MHLDGIAVSQDLGIIKWYLEVVHLKLEYFWCGSVKLRALTGPSGSGEQMCVHEGL